MRIVYPRIHLLIFFFWETSALKRLATFSHQADAYGTWEFWHLLRRWVSPQNNSNDRTDRRLSVGIKCCMHSLEAKLPSGCKWYGGVSYLQVSHGSLDEGRMVEGTDPPLRNTTSRDVGKGELHFPWVATTLASVLITTIVVDILGNLLVIISVFRNRKLRKAGMIWYLCERYRITIKVTTLTMTWIYCISPLQL